MSGGGQDMPSLDTKSSAFRLRQIRGSHEEAIAFASGATTFIEGPDDEALAAAAVAGGKDAGEAGGVFLVLGLDVAAGIAVHIEGIEERLFRPEETHGEEDELGGEDFLRSRDVFRNELSLLVFRPLDLHGVHSRDVAVSVAFKFCRRGNIDPGIAAKLGGGFFLTVVHFVSLRPFGPWIVLGALVWRTWHDFHLAHAGAAMTQ